jgi:cytochrome P450
MRQVQDETLRLSTLAPWAARYSNKDVTVCGYKVPAKTPIITALGVALKNRKEWEEEEK